MKVKLQDIPDEGLTLTEKVNPEQIKLDTPEVHFTGQVGVKASFHKQQETVWVEVGVEGQTEQICGRCLSAYPKEYDNNFHLDYEPGPAPELDVTDDIRQEILLSYPVQFLCREDCRGLCPQCGTNLNERSCSHASS